MSSLDRNAIAGQCDTSLDGKIQQVAEEDLQKKKTAATAAKNIAEAKAQKAAEKEETNRAMTEAGLICLVEIRIKYQPRQSTPTRRLT